MMQAIMQRLQPQMQQQQKAQAAALANQGIVPGTVAYDNAMRTFNQQQNDLMQVLISKVDQLIDATRDVANHTETTAMRVA